ncbi:MAG TPA: MaoC/PaaZ C-terminal domain-containing protein [Stellaceae bacterium]|nr:MaoC/PaaZ C-terminal domain-containing protein [Stellaceae bacterium]
MSERPFDDVAAGERFLTRGVTLSESAIIDFAMVYDSQPFHIDIEAARQSHYGGFIAGGFQTLAPSFRMVLETGIFRAAGMGSPGFDELRRLEPVRPGDALHVEPEIVETAPSRSKPERGILCVACRVGNRRDENVPALAVMRLLKRRARGMSEARFRHRGSPP